MTISPASLPRYFHRIDFPVPVYTKGGGGRSAEFVMDAPRAILECLIAANAVYGIGNWSKLRRVHLDVPPETIEALVEKKRREAAVSLPEMDLVQKTVSARKFTYREQLFVTEAGVTVRSGHWVWSHKGWRGA